MSEYIITNCTVHDGPEMARNNTRAFWEDPNWRCCWAHTNLERVIANNILRAPMNLLKDRDILRHFKAVDPKTGKFVGYIRWKLPLSRLLNKDGSPVWPEGQTPNVSPEERAQIHKTAGTAIWDPLEYGGEDDLDAILGWTKNKYLAEHEYMYLDYFAVHPDFQRRGIGTALIRHGIKKAQELSIDIFVMALEGGFKAYENTGFRLLESIVQDATRIGGSDRYPVQFMDFMVNKD